MTNGAIIYQGPSPANGANIALIATGLGTKSANPKTGVMIQTFILDVDTPPHDAQKSGLDESTCGDCALRPSRQPDRDKSCYVLTFQAPLSVWKAFRRGAYPVMTPADVGAIARRKNRPIRLGAYGDPAMVPFEVIAEMLDASDTGHTGYTHQWDRPWFDARYLTVIMASVDNDDQLDRLPADARYFRVATDDTPRHGEITCPATVKDSDGNALSTCAQCQLCAGSNKSAKNIVTAYQ